MNLFKKAVLLILTGVLLAAVPVMAEDALAKTSVVVKLRYEDPLNVMYLLGLINKQESISGKNITWDRSNSAKSKEAASTGNASRLANKPGDMIPFGIDVVTAVSEDQSLVIYGDQKSVNEMIDLLHMLDVKRKQVQIKFEFIKLTEQQARSVGIDTRQLSGNIETSPAGIAITNPNTIKKLEEHKIGTLFYSPVINTANQIPATIAIGTDDKDKAAGTTIQSLFVLPRVNGNGSITMYIDTTVVESKSAGISGVPQESKQSIRSNRRVVNGETFMVEAYKHDKNYVVILATPTIME